MNFTKEKDGGAEDGRAEFYQHLYMGLVRAETLDRLLISNFPRDEAGDLGWSFFEEGPPQYLVQFMKSSKSVPWKRIPNASVRSRSSEHLPGKTFRSASPMKQARGVF